MVSSRFLDGPEPTLTKEERIRTKLTDAGIFDFKSRMLPNGTIEVEIERTPDSEVLSIIGVDGFVKKE